MSNTTATSSDVLVRHVAEALDDGKAVDIRVLDVRGMTVITDFMVVASGRSARQVKALTDRVREAAAALGQRVIGAEGAAQGDWVLVDLGDVIVHIMQPAVREFYQIEKLWEDPARAAAGTTQADIR